MGRRLRPANAGRSRHRRGPPEPARGGVSMRIRYLVLFWMTLAHVAAAGEGLAPWAGNTHPTDAARTHVEEIAAGEYKYVVTQGGTMDGRNCRSPMGCGMSREGAFEQTWESNRSVRMENVGDTDLISPWL